MPLEELIASLIEKSLIGGAFLYMLHFFLTKFSTSLDNVGNNLKSVSDALLKMNIRLDNIEKRMDKVESERIDV